MFTTLLTFEMEREVFLWEYGDRSYGIIPYYLSKTFIEIPFMFIFPFIFSAITYFAIGYEVDFLRFLFFSFSLCMIVICASSYGMMISAAFKHAAVDLAPIFMMPLIIFGGFMANSEEYPGYITWIQYISPIWYTLESLFWNEFDNNTTYDHVWRNPMEVFGFSLGKWNCILYLAIISIVTRTLALLFLRLFV